MIKYRLAKSQDVNEIVDIHLKTFESFFLSSLGPGFLKLYYRSSIKFKDAVMVCALDTEDNIVGFSMGTLVSSGFHKKLILRNLFSFSSRAFIVLLTKPKALYRLKKNLSKNANSSDTGDYAELLSIGVLPDSKGLGIGKGLLIEFEKRVKQKGIDKISLTTDFKNNQSVLNFYRSLNYEVFYEFKAYPNRKMYRLIKKI